MESESIDDTLRIWFVSETIRPSIENVVAAMPHIHVPNSLKCSPGACAFRLLLCDKLLFSCAGGRPSFLFV